VISRTVSGLFTGRQHRGHSPTGRVKTLRYTIPEFRDRQNLEAEVCSRRIGGIQMALKPDQDALSFRFKLLWMASNNCSDSGGFSI
jgi:hypothetical protein